MKNNMFMYVVKQKENQHWGDWEISYYENGPVLYKTKLN